MREPAKSFQDLLVWQKAHQFVLFVYRLTGTFPKNEIFGLSSQFRRSAVSVAANIAEGFKKRGTADKARFLNMAQGSLEESRYYLNRQAGMLIVKMIAWFVYGRSIERPYINMLKNNLL